MSLQCEVVAKLEAGHTRGVTCVAFSPDGHFLASGSLDSTVCLWNLSSPYKLEHVFTGASPVLSLAWVNKDVVLCGLQDGTVATFSMEARSRVDMAAFSAHKYPVEHLSVRKNFLASAGHPEGFVWEYNPAALAKWKLLAPIPDPPNELPHISHSKVITALGWLAYNHHADSLLVCYLHHGISIINSANWTCIRHISKNGLIASASLSEDGCLLAVCNVTAGFDIYRMSSGDWIASLPDEHRDAADRLVTPVLLVHGGRALLTGGLNSTAKIWDVETKQVLQTLHIGTTRRRRVQALAAYALPDQHHQAKGRSMIAMGVPSRESPSPIVLWRACEVAVETFSSSTSITWSSRYIWISVAAVAVASAAFLARAMRPDLSIYH